MCDIERVKLLLMALMTLEGLYVIGYYLRMRQTPCQVYARQLTPLCVMITKGELSLSPLN